MEIPGVPLTVAVTGGKAADNTHLAHAICEASKSVSPGLQITRIRWLHNQRTPVQRLCDACEERAKTRGSLIVGFLTEEMQCSAIWGGLIVDAQLFKTRPFDKTLQITWCFKCQQWGHTQFACGKQARCAQCAGQHPTAKCMNERVSCANCGKKHRAWQYRKCPSYQAYQEGIQRKRVALYAQVYSMRQASSNIFNQEEKPTIQSQHGQTDKWTIVSRKRSRAHSMGTEDCQHQVGRPTYIEQAARSSSQQRITFNRDTAPTLQMRSTPNARFSNIVSDYDEL